MHTFYLSALVLFGGLQSVLAAPVESVNSTIKARIDFSKLLDGAGGKCSDFGYMSLGQLEVHNNFNADLAMWYTYDGPCPTGLSWSGCKGLKPLRQSENPKFISEKGWYEYDRDAADGLRTLKRNTNFWLVARDALGSSQQQIPGTFRVPPVGAKQWVAKVDLSSGPNGVGRAAGAVSFTIAADCVVDRAMRDAWAP